MSRKYTHIEKIEPEIQEMREAGKTRREIAEYYGLSIVQIKNLVNRQNRKKRKQTQGILPKSKGRPRKDGESPIQSEKAELERLRMENKLLRDFLQYIGRK